MPASVPPRGFHVAPFALDGELIEARFLPLETLSARWLEVCAGFLSRNGSCFRSAWAPPLGHIETTFSSCRGAALATFYVGGRLASVCALASGRDSGGDAEALGTFVATVRRLRAVQASAASSSAPFGRALALAERPLLAVCSRGDPFIGEADEELSRELTRHVAGAYFTAPPAVLLAVGVAGAW